MSTASRNSNDMCTELFVHSRNNIHINILVKDEGLPGLIINIGFERHDWDKKNASLIINLLSTETQFSRYQGT